MNDMVELPPVDEDDHDGPGLTEVFLASASAAVAVLGIQHHAYWAWALGNWGPVSWLPPGLMTACAALVSIYGWRHGGRLHPAAYPVLVAGGLALIAAIAAWRL